MSDRVAGVAFVKVDGKQLVLGGKVSGSMQTKKREGVIGLSGPAGYKEEVVIPFIEVEVIKTPDLRIQDILDVTNATVQAEGADGTLYVLANAYHAGESPLELGEGTVTFKFEGKRPTEVSPV